ncbi:MAG: plastocyanin/azurin family copper-binding protein [Verrucomicrobiota bacterium]
MKRPILACAFAVSLAFATGALGHGDENHGKRGSRSADGHAATLGRPGNPEDVNRSIEVEMSDSMRFRPDRIRVQRGDTVRFIVRNTGKLRHEMVLGTAEELKEHAATMRKHPDMEHSDPNQVRVEPGETGELIWEFNREGTFDFACLEPGHLEAGMVGEIVVGRESE